MHLIRRHLGNVLRALRAWTDRAADVVAPEHNVELVANAHAAVAAERAASASAAPKRTAYDDVLDTLRWLAATREMRCEICRMLIEAFADQPLAVRQRAFRLVGSPPFVDGPAGEVCAFHALLIDAAASSTIHQELN